MKKFSLFLSVMLISMMSFAQGVTHDVVVENATTSPEGQNIVLSGIWEEKALTVMLWQGGATQGFGTYATDDYGPIIWGAAELTPKAEGVYTDKGDGTFTFTCTATDATDTYNISMKGANPAVEPEEPEAQYVDFYATAEFSDNIWAEAEDGTALDLYFAEDQPYNGEGTYTVTAIYSDAEWTEYNVAGSVTVEYDDVEGTEVLMGDLSTTDGSLNVHVVITKAGSGSVEGTPMEVNVTNLEVNYATTAFTGTDEYGMFTVSLVPNTNKPIEGKPMTFELDLENSSILYSMGWVSSPLTLVSGEITIDMNAPSATAIVTASLEDQTFVLTINMTATASESVDINLEATSAVVDEDVLTLYATYEDEEGNTFPVAVELQGFENVEGLKEYEAEEICKITIGDPNSEVETEFMDIAYANSVAVIIGEESENSISLEGDFSSWATGSNYYVTITGTLPVSEPEPALKGVVKRAVQLGESVVVLTHEADGTAHIYNVVDTVITEVSLEGVAPIDPENKGSYLAISDIAVTEDGKLVANNYNRCSFNDGVVESGYKRGTLTFYIWNDLAAAPAIWFQSKASSNSNNSDQGYTMALTGTSTNADILVTGVHNTHRGIRMSHFSVIDGQYEDTPDGGKKEPYYYYIGSNFKGASAGADAAVFNEQTQGVNIQFLASPLAEENWIIDGELVNPIEFTNPQTHGGEVVKGQTLTTDLGKKFNGATILKEGEQVLMVAPYADAEGKLAGVKVLDITDGLAADSVVATLDLDAPVAATAAATAVEVAAYDVNITLVADGNIYNLVHKLPKPVPTETTVSRVFAYDLSSELSEDGATLTVNYTLNANADAVEVVILSGEEVVKTVPVRGINKGTYSVEVSTAGLPQEGDLTWAVNAKGAPVAGIVEVTDQSRGIYDFYNMMDVLVDNNPESEYFGKIYIQMALNGASDGSTERAQTQKAGLFIYDQNLNELNPTSNVGIQPTLPEGYTMGTNRNEFHRLDIDPKTGNLTYCYNISGQPAVFSIDRANLTGNVTNLLEGVEGISRTSAHCFDAEGALYVYDLPGAGIIHKVVDGVATVFAAEDAKWVQASASMAVDGRGGLWVAQYRGQMDTYYQLVHYTSAGVADFAVYQGSENGFTGSSARGALAYDVERQILAQGRNGAVELFNVAYDAETGVPTLTKFATTPTVGNNIDGLHFDYAGDLYVVNSSKEKFQKFAVPTENNECTTPAASKYAFTLAPEPVYSEIAEEVTDLVMDTENMTLAGKGNNYGIEIYLTLGQDNLDGTFTLDPENSFVTINGWDANFIEGYAYDLDFEANTAKALTKVELNGEYMAITFDMSSKPVEALNIVITDATIAIDTIPLFGDAVDYALKMTANWTDTTDNTTYPVLVEVPVYYPEATEPSEISCTVTVGGLGDNDPWLGSGEGDLIISTVNGVVTAQGLVKNTWTAFAANVTVSGKLPVEEPVKYTVTATVNPAETGTVTGAGEYEEGAEATLTATAAEGYEFVNWTVAGAEVATTATYTFTVTADVEVVANFKEITDAVDNIQVGVKATKVLRNGQLIIIKNDVEYNAQGAVVK